MDAKSIGLSISKLRKKSNLTQAQLAEKLNISDKTVSRWENGLGFPEITQFPVLASLFGVTVDYIMTGERKGITIVGNILTDIVKNIDVFPKIGKLSHIKDISQCVGGSAVNTAINLAKIDRNILVSVIGKIGDDEYGRYILSKLSRHNVDSEKIIISPDIPTSFCDVMTVPSGESAFFHTDGANAVFSPDEIDISYLQSSILHLGYVVPLGYFDSKDSLYGTAAARFLHNVKERGIKTSLGIMSDNTQNYKQKMLPLLKYCDYVILNQAECNILSGLETSVADKESLKKAMHFISECGVKEKIIIHCKNAAFCYDVQTKKFTVSPALNIPDNMIKSRVGSGDAFCAGCLYGIYNKLPDKYILEFAASAEACSLFSDNSIAGMLNKYEIENLPQKYEWRKL